MSRVARAARWFDDNVLSLGRDMRLSYLSLLMVYITTNISKLTTIINTFFIKKYLNLSTKFLTTLKF